MKCKERRFLCDANHDMRIIVQNLIKILETAKNYGDVSIIDDALEELAIAEEIVEEIQDYAESMENRLKKYKNAIESLGFERKY